MEEEDEEDGDEDPYKPQDVDEEGEDELLLLARRDGRVGVESMQRSDGDEVENEEDEEGGDEEEFDEEEVDEEENDEVKRPHLHHCSSSSSCSFGELKIRVLPPWRFNGE